MYVREIVCYDVNRMWRNSDIWERDQNSIHEGIKNRRNKGNACYHAVQKLLSSRLLSKNVKINT
jgi:hypothetical protein